MPPQLDPHERSESAARPSHPAAQHNLWPPGAWSSSALARMCRAKLRGRHVGPKMDFPQFIFPAPGGPDSLEVRGARPVRLVLLDDRSAELPGVRGDKGLCCSQTRLTLQRPRNIRNADPGKGSAGSGLEAVHSRQRIFVCDSLRPKVLLRPPFSSPRPPRVRSSVGLPRAPRVRSSAGFRARALCAEGRTGGNREIHWKL